MLVELAPGRLVNPETGTLIRTFAEPYPLVTFTPLDRLTHDEASRVKDALTEILLRQRVELEDLLNRRVTVPTSPNGTVELLDGEERVPALSMADRGPFERVKADGRCACPDCD